MDPSGSIMLSRRTADLLDTIGEGDILLADRAYEADRLHTVATRVEKHIAHHLAVAKLAAIQTWLRGYGSVF